MIVPSFCLTSPKNYLEIIRMIYLFDRIQNEKYVILYK